MADGGALEEMIGLVPEIVAEGSTDGDSDAVPDIDAVDDALEERENPDTVAFDERETKADSECCGLCVTRPLLAVKTDDGDNELLTVAEMIDETDSAGEDELVLVSTRDVSGEPVTDTETIEDGDDVGRLLLGERDILALFETLEERDAVAQKVIVNWGDAETLEDAVILLEALGETVAEFSTVDVGRIETLGVRDELTEPVPERDTEDDPDEDDVGDLDTGDTVEFTVRLGALESDGTLVDEGSTDVLIVKEELAQLVADSEVNGENVGEMVEVMDTGDAVEFMERLGVLVSEGLVDNDGGIELLGVTLELTEYDEDTVVVDEIDGDVLAEPAALSDRVEFIEVKLVREDVRNAVIEAETDSDPEEVTVFDTFDDAELKKDAVPEGEADIDGSVESKSPFDLVGDREPDSDEHVVEDMDGEFDALGILETVVDAEAQEDGEELTDAAMEGLRVPNALGEMVEFDENEYEVDEVKDIMVLVETVMVRVSRLVMEAVVVRVASIDGDDELCKDVLSV